jgi:hypothetical protein
MPAEQANGVSSPATSPSAAPRGPWAKFLSYLRGDRYMAGAYPPEWQEPVKAGASAAEVPAAAGIPVGSGSEQR